MPSPMPHGASSCQAPGPSSFDQPQPRNQPSSPHEDASQRRASYLHTSSKVYASQILNCTPHWYMLTISPPIGYCQDHDTSKMSSKARERRSKIWRERRYVRDSEDEDGSMSDDVDSDIPSTFAQSPVPSGDSAKHITASTIHDTSYRKADGQQVLTSNFFFKSSS